MATSIFELNPERTAAIAEQEDLRLVDSLRDGNEYAYEQLLLRFQQPVYALALRLLDDPSEAFDVVQEVFLKVFRNIGSFRGQSTLKTWIYRITVNEAHNARRWFFRHRRREVELDTDPEVTRNWKEIIPDHSRSPFDVASDREQHVMLEAALDRINPIFREAVVLRDITDLSYEEIAEVIGVSLGTVKSRILRGREALKEQLAGSLKSRPALQLVPKTAE
ncbi:MAG TPA: sigma-70 family RNA polymerase sigma factor [Candidatus Acidoferrales bacterium]|nr:sigma-70 family RNA polymerase sigma factor [Candidatus Acidoferrales bacterium]